MALCFTAPDAKRLVDYLGSLVIWSRGAWVLCGSKEDVAPPSSTPKPGPVATPRP